MRALSMVGNYSGRFLRTGKPGAIRGRKAAEPSRLAGPPKRTSRGVLCANAGSWKDPAF